ncbi:hypothetical protein LCGC14_2045520 [marine sediment metagenome]|uniref:Periplasmic copper-binding protein NosD beta helix domain-containing protein n=1 Tax=marine sediment metagenome TaxID=412755 RepID=A0A0F9FD71_9ZZZZ
MKKKSLLILIVPIALGIFFSVSVLYYSTLDFNIGIGDKSSEYHDSINSRSENLKLSAVDSKIYISGNSGWVAFKNAGNCTGSGTDSDPYVIKDLVLDSGGQGDGIKIEDSDVYFKIENSTIYNSGTILFDAGGIRLVNVTNGIVTNNTITSIYKGIYIEQSDNIIISGNRANNNSYNGIYLWYSMNIIVSGNIVNNNGNDGIQIHDNSNNINVSGNIVNNNYDDGIYLIYSIDNIITGNTINNNGDDGIFLLGSNINIVSGNTLIGNQDCITEQDSQGNVFSDNGSCSYGEEGTTPAIPGYNLLFLIGTLSALSFIILKKIKRTSKIK